MDAIAAQTWTPTRAAGLDALTAFQPAMGSLYAKRRNHDLGAGRHDGVSRLSPWLRRRLLTEAEVVATAVEMHRLSGAEKFVQEVFWRSYFKGWLENRPSVWLSYCTGLQRDLEAVATDRGLARRVAAAEEGRTGLDFFDTWVQELVETGYLHNHARMWFASVWVFTLGLPWRVGADFFLAHLLDGDPASNTLGWRWVAGLHTRGKTYEAQAWNIAKFTGGRFDPQPSDLARDVVPLEEPGDLPPPGPLRLPDAPDRDAVSVLLVTEEDCLPETLGLRLGDMAGVATLAASSLRSPRAVAEHVTGFDAGALADAGRRAQAAGAPGEVERLGALKPAWLAEWARARGAHQIVTGYVPTGPVRDWLDAAAPALDDAGVRLAEVRRDWDAATWPHATAGFFKVKTKIPKILDTLA